MLANTQTDPTDDVPPHEADLTLFLARQMAQGVTHRELLSALLTNYRALARVYPCCTAAAANAALQVGGHLMVACIERPANATTH